MNTSIEAQIHDGSGGLLNLGDLKLSRIDVGSIELSNLKFPYYDRSRLVLYGADGTEIFSVSADGIAHVMLGAHVRIADAEVTVTRVEVE